MFSELDLHARSPGPGTKQGGVGDQSELHHETLFFLPNLQLTKSSMKRLPGFPLHPEPWERKAQVLYQPALLAGAGLAAPPPHRASRVGLPPSRAPSQFPPYCHGSQVILWGVTLSILEYSAVSLALSSRCQSPPSHCDNQKIN